MYRGLTAKLTVDEKEIGYVSNWSVEQARDTIEVTKLGSEAKEFMPSFVSWTASAEGTADFGDEGQNALINAFNEGKKVDVEFYLDYNETSLTCLKGTAIIDKLSIDISAEDKGNISINLTGDKKLTLTAPVISA